VLRSGELEFRDVLGDFLYAHAATIGDQMLRSIACACCRRIWHLLADPRSRDALELAERFVAGEAGQQELEHADQAAWEAVDDVRGSAIHHADRTRQKAAYAVLFAVHFRRSQEGSPLWYDAQFAMNAAGGAASAAGRAAAELITDKGPDRPALLMLRAEVERHTMNQELETQRGLVRQLLADISHPRL
jgi:hypothetical protein